MLSNKRGFFKTNQLYSIKKYKNTGNKMLAMMRRWTCHAKCIVFFVCEQQTGA